MKTADQQSLIPIPDPTLLTVAALKEGLEKLEELTDTRITSAVELLEEKIKHNFLMDEKRHRETREWLAKMEEHRLEIKAESEKVLSQALAYRKELFDQARRCNEEAVSRQAEAFANQIEALSKRVDQIKESLSNRIAEIKTTIDKGVGKQEEHHEGKLTGQWVVGLIVAVVIALIGDVLVFVHVFVK